MNGSPFLSICIPYYNAGEYFNNCLRSIDSQTFKNYEVVVVDDGSIQPLHIDVSKYPRLANRIRVIRQNNSGSYLARKTAVAHARGKYIFFVDSDDCLYDSNTLNLIHELLSVHQPELLLLNAIDDNEIETIKYQEAMLNRPLETAEVFSFLLRSPEFNSVYTMLFSSNIKLSEFHAPKLVIAEDRLIKADVICQAKSIVACDVPVYRYISNPSSIMHSTFKPIYSSNRVFVEQALELIGSDLDIDNTAWMTSKAMVYIASLLDVVYSHGKGYKWRITMYEVITSSSAFSSDIFCILKGDIRLFDKICLYLAYQSRFHALDAILLFRTKLAKSKANISRIRSTVHS